MAIPLFMLEADYEHFRPYPSTFPVQQESGRHFPEDSPGECCGQLIMAGMSGSELADASAIGKVLIPSMKEEGYDSEFAAAVTGAASTIGPFPTSIPMV